MLGPVLSTQSFDRALASSNQHYAVGDYNKDSYTLNLQLLLLVFGVVGAGLMEVYKVYHSWQKRQAFALITGYILNIEDENPFADNPFIDIKLTGLPYFRLEKIDGLISVMELNERGDSVGQACNTGVTFHQLQAKLAIDILRNNLKKNLACKPAAARVFFDVIARPDVYGENYSDQAKWVLGDMVAENYESYAQYCQQKHKNQKKKRSFNSFVYKKIKAKLVRYQLVKADQPLPHGNVILQEIGKHITMGTICCAVEATRPYIQEPLQRTQELTLINNSTALFDQVLKQPTECNRIALIRVCDFFNELVERTPPIVKGLGIALTLEDYIAIYERNCRDRNKVPATSITALKIIITMCLACIPVERIATHLFIDSSEHALTRLKLVGSEHLNQLASYFDDNLFSAILTDIEPPHIRDLMDQCTLNQLELMFYHCRPAMIERLLQGGTTINTLIETIVYKPF